jgi:enoyl-CoA hydratase/carnithine racemase
VSEAVVLAIEKGVGVLTLNEPATRNALSDTMIDALCRKLQAAVADPMVSCLILTGEGSAFCAGGSIKDMRDRTGYAGGGPINAWRAMSGSFQRVPRVLRSLDVPVIAAVNGPAIGAGCDIVAMCDLRIASDTAVFGETFINLGVISGDGGTWFLSRAVGRARAAEMTLTGETIDAATAAAWGLVSRVVPGPTLMDEAHSLAAKIARHSPSAVRLATRLLRAVPEQNLEPSLELAAAMQGVLLHTDDHKEAVAAMLDKRGAVFHGR